MKRKTVFQKVQSRNPNKEDEEYEVHLVFYDDEFIPEKSGCTCEHQIYRGSGKRKNILCWHMLSVLKELEIKA